MVVHWLANMPRPLSDLRPSRLDFDALLNGTSLDAIAGLWSTHEIWRRLDQLADRLWRHRWRSNPRVRPLLFGRSVDRRDISYLLHGLYGLCACHQWSRSTVFNGAPSCDRQRNGRHTLVIRDIRDENEIKITEAIPCADEFASYGLACLAANGFDTILRILHLSGPRLRRIGPLIQVERQIEPS